MTSRKEGFNPKYLSRQTQIKYKPEDLKRLFYDQILVDDLSLDQINDLKDRTMHIHPTIESFAFQEREEGMREFARRYALWHKFMHENGFGNELNNSAQLVLDLARFHLDFGLIYLAKYAFQPAVELLASEEQWARYGSKINQLQIIGTYAQTELGHGSDVQSLQTTAEFDLETQEFVFHTPGTEAIKFYSGAMGKCANHALVMARLISNKVDYGVQGFLIQIRDLKTHKALPGIEVGDIGSKICLPYTDNGYLIMNHYRAPKDALLSRYVDIKPDGTLTHLNPNAKILAYGGMLNLRVLIVYSSLIYLGKMVTIVSRYANKRRQFPGVDKKEVPVITYQGLQYKIAPCIAATFVVLFTVQELLSMNDIYKKLLFESGGKDEKLFPLLAKLHSHTAIFKAMSTWFGDHFGELMKQGAGGHGYLVMSGLTRAHLDFGIGIQTAEGDNIVMVQQTAKALMKQLQTGQINPDQFLYDREKELTLEEELVLLMEIRYKTQLKRVGEKVAKLMADGLDFGTQIWNEHCQVDLVDAAVYYGHFFAVQNMLEVLKGREQHRVATNMKQRPKELQDLMFKMLRVYCIYQIEQDQVSFTKNFPSVEDFKFFQSRIEGYRQVMREECFFISTHAEDIVEAFDFRDEELLSAIGSKKTKTEDEIYENMLEIVRKNPLNKNPVPKGFNTYMAHFPKL